VARRGGVGAGRGGNAAVVVNQKNGKSRAIAINPACSGNNMQWIQKLVSAEPWPKGALAIAQYQAHRGFCKNGAVENTLVAFRQARQNGFLMCECDCQLSKDKIPIVFHDTDLKRLGAESILVKDLTAAQLKEKVQAPALFEVLTDFQVPPLLNIELKTNVKFDEALERKVAELIERTRTQHKVMFSSFNPFSLWRIANYLPEVPRALLVSPELSSENKRALREMWLAPLLKIHMLNLQFEMLNDSTIDFWCEKNMPLSAWTVNDSQIAKQLLKKGVLSVITDEKVDPQ
jgi:glycerophosphoryl diester phosphodiesterase